MVAHREIDSEVRRIRQGGFRRVPPAGHKLLDVNGGIRHAYVEHWYTANCLPGVLRLKAARVLGDADSWSPALQEPEIG